MLRFRQYAILLATLALATTVLAQDGPVLKDPNNLSLRNEMQTAIDRGLAFLKTQQKPDGSWSNPDHPAQPSQYDLDHAWPNLSYVIVAVAAATPGDVRSWRLRADRSAFEEELQS